MKDAQSFNNILTEASDSKEEDLEYDEVEVDAFSAFSVHATNCRSTVAMGVSTRVSSEIINAVMIDTGSSVITSFGSTRTTALRAASVRPTNTVTSSRSIRGIGGITMSIGTIQFKFYFGGKLYTGQVHVIPGDTPSILSHRDLGRLELDYWSLYKLVNRPSDGYTEPVEIRNNLRYMVFTSPGHLTEAKLRIMHRNLGHPTLEKKMKVIETTGIGPLPRKTRKVLKEIDDDCKACQPMRVKQRRFLFSMRDDITGEFNHVLPIDVVHLSDGNVLHLIYMGTSFQQGTFIS